MSQTVGVILRAKKVRSKRLVLKRLPSRKFQEYRRQESSKGSVDMVAGDSWNKMAIVRVHRRKQPKLRYIFVAVVQVRHKL